MSSVDYFITGEVESVSYTKNTDFPCYVALAGTAHHHNFYHASKNVAACMFAERCRTLGLEVRMGALVADGANILDSIEYNNTKAKYWICNEVIC